MGWLTKKVRACITTIQRASASDDIIDFVSNAVEAADPDVREAYGYLEAIADILDLTVSEMVSELRVHGRRELLAQASIAPSKH